MDTLKMQSLYDVAEKLLASSESKFFRKYYLLIIGTYFYFIGLFLLGLVLFFSGIFIITAKVVYIGIFVLSTGAYIINDLLKLAFKRKPRNNRQGIDRKKYPKLDQLISDIEKELGIQVKKITFDLSFNAGADSSPYFLFFGQRNVLHIGILLLLSLSPEQLKWVLAHELGHMSRKHGYISSWSYRTYYSLLDLYKYMSQRNETSVFIRPFFMNIWPKLSAMQFVLSKKFEFDVDKDAASLTSGEIGANALLYSEYYSKLSQVFFSNLYKESKDNPTAPTAVYHKYIEYAQTTPVSEKHVDEIIESLNIKSNYFDTHPSVQDRIRALTGESVAKEQLIKKLAVKQRSAFNAYVDDTQILDTLGLEWSKLSTANWEYYHAQYASLQKIEEEYSVTQDIKTLESITHLKHNIGGHEFSKDNISEILRVDPVNKVALILAFQHAVYMRNVDESERLAEKINTSHPTEQYSVYEYLRSLYLALGNQSKVEEIESTQTHLQAQYYEYSQRIRSLPQKTDIFVKSKIQDTEAGTIIEALKNFKVVKEVYVVDRKIDMFGISEQLIVFVVPFFGSLNKTKRLNTCLDSVIKSINATNNPYLLRAIVVSTSVKGVSWIKKEFETDSFTSIYKNKRSAILEPLYVLLAIVSIMLVAFLIPAVIVGENPKKIWFEGTSLNTNVGEYTDALSGMKIVVPENIKGWEFSTEQVSPRWIFVYARKVLTTKDLDELSKYSLSPDLVKKASDIRFVQISFAKRISVSEDDLSFFGGKFFSKEVTTESFHRGSGLNSGSTNSDIVENPNEDLKVIDFKNHYAITSTISYQNRKYSTFATQRVTSFIVPETANGYIVSYAAPKPLYEKYELEASQIIDSLIVPGNK